MVFPLAYMELQVHFAQRIAKLTGTPYHDVLWLDTGLPDILASSDPDPNDDVFNSLWQQFLAALGEEGTGIDAAYDIYRQRLLQGNAVAFGQDLCWFGCFAPEYVASSKVICIHFSDKDTTGYGSLSNQRREARLSELHDLFTYVYQQYPESEQLVAGSWILGRYAFNRLLPPEIASAAQEADVQLGYGNVRSAYLHGGGLWGQFLTHNRQLNKRVAAQFRMRLDMLRDPHDFASCFPYAMFMINGPIGTFYKFYGVI